MNLNFPLGQSCFSFDFSKNPEFVLMAKNKVSRSNSAIEITNYKNNNSNHNSTFSGYTNEVVSNESFMASTNSKVPDILMINKYYGLIPQKFTISSRKAGSTPSSASSSSRRSAKSSAKPRAKSSTYQHASRSKPERRLSEEKTFGSENESSEPIKMILISRRGSGSGCESPVEKPSDPFGPVTKKMSVERYKRWKSCGGGKGRNMNIRSNSDIGKTLSQLDNRLPGGCLNSHAKNNNRVSTADYMTNRRVIKIDLKRVSSWDEENYRITTSSVEPTESENKESKLKVANPATTHNNDSDCTLENGNINRISSSNISNSCCYSSCNSYIFSANTGYSRSRSSSSSEEKSSSTFSTSRPDNNGSFTCLVNNDNDCDSVVSNGDNQEKEKTALVSSVDTLVDINESSSSEIMTTTSNNSTITSCVTSSVEMPMSDRQEPSFDDGEPKKLFTGGGTGAAVDEHYDNNEEKEDKHIMHKGMIGSCENAQKICHDKKVASMQRCGKLSSRTISFDDKILDGSLNRASDREESSSRTECLAKRRPTTASARVNSKTFSTPNGFNPPSKVIPWTQQKTAGGKSLTLAERRAKFQRVSSIHSSSSMSMDCGDEEGFSEVESNNQNCARPPSSAFRESRKPLHVTQPPEIPTMISQINPNADEDIQIEIEKVALMLKKMHSMKHFSMSLDSGIEAEMGKVSTSSEASSTLRKGPSASTESLGTFQDTNAKELKASGSESSVSSTDNSEEDHESQAKSKINTMPSALTSKAVSLCSINGGSKPIKIRETTSGFDGLIKRQCSTNSNSSASKHSPNNVRSNSNTKKINLPLSSTSTTAVSTTNTVTTPRATSAGSSSVGGGTIRRHPFKKAMSISCEQELLMSGGEHKRNEVNSNANDNGKSLRPKTATLSNSQSQRNNVSGTRSSTNNNCHYRQNSISTSSESHHATGATAASASGSQGSRNRKILIKKALMKINQSSPNMKKMWGTVGRPRTAPSSEKTNLTSHAQQNQQHPRKPLKASPFAISGNGKSGLLASGNSVSTGGGKTNSKLVTGDKTMDKTSPTGQIQRSSSDAPDDTGDKLQGSQQQSESKGDNSNRRQSVFRQCFSLDESALLGFSIKSVNEGRIPIFEKLQSADSTDS